jgi:Ala-tRNA(Pro) deacylase
MSAIASTAKGEVMSIAAFLEDQAVEFEALPHPPAYSAQKLAKYLHVPGKQVAKSLLLYGPQGFVLAVLPATMNVDLTQLAEALGGHVRLAVEPEIAAFFHDCEWGVVPPFGTLYGLPIILQDSFDPASLMVFEGKSHVEAVRMRCADFERLERPRRLRFAVAPR